MKKIKIKIDDFFFNSKFDPKSMFFFRVSLVLILIILQILLWNSFYSIHFSGGYIQRDISETFVNPLVINSYQLTDFLNYAFGISEISSLSLIRWVYLAFLVFLSFGLVTRFSAFVCWFLHLSLVKSGHYYMYGADFIHTFMLFFCIFLPVGRFFSIDNLIFKPTPISSLTVRVFQIQVCIIYFFAGIGKFIGPNWWNGESVWRAINRPMLGDFDFQWFADNPIIPTVLGITTIFVELLYPIAIWIRPINIFWFWAIIMMHLSIAFFLDLHVFSVTMIALNFSAFYFQTNKDTNSSELSPA